MKKLIAHPEWDSWVILIAVLTLLLAVFMGLITLLHRNVLGPDGRPSPAVFMVMLGIIIFVATILILSEARNARKWLTKVSPVNTLRGYVSIKSSLFGLAFGILICWMMVSPGTKPTPLNIKITSPFLLSAIGFSLVRRSRLSPWAIPEVELTPTGLALPSPIVLSSDGSWKRIKPPGKACLIPWDSVESISWRSEGRAGPHLYITTKKTVWFGNWGAYARAEHGTPTEQVVNLKSTLAGDTIPPDAVVLAAQRYIEYSNKE